MIANDSVEVDGDYRLDYVLLFRLIVWGYIGMILSLFGIVGNLITILVILSSSLRTTSTNMYLTALACSNILFLLIFIPSYSIKYLLGYRVYMSNQPPFPFEVLLARLPTTPIYNTILLSMIYLTIAVSMDRLILVKFPLKAKRILTRRTTLTTIGFIYLFSILYCLPYWFEQHYVPEAQQCRFTEFGQKIHKYIRIHIYIPVVYVIPFVTLTCINITIIQYLIAKRRHKQSLVGKMNRKKSADHHITLMLVAIIIVFVLCQLPLLVLNVWHAIDPRGSYESLIFHLLNSIGILLTVFNTSTNFLLYCFFGQKFRLTLIELILKIFTKHPERFNSTMRNSEDGRLPLRTTQRAYSNNPSTRTSINDPTILQVKHDDTGQQALSAVSTQFGQGVIISCTEESRPLLKFITMGLQDKNGEIANM